MSGTIVSVALAVFAVGLLILVHEFGHFIAAKALGVRVEVFSIGFWKSIITFKKGGTEYRLSLVPLGGYVKLAGEYPGDGAGKPDELRAKSPGQRALIFVAGVVLNAVLAVVVFVTAFAIGVPFTVAEVGQLSKGWPAWKAGMRRGDRIVSIDGTAAPDFNDVTRIVALGGKDVLRLEVQRGTETLEFELEPRYKEDLGIRWIGINPPLAPVVSGLARIGGEDGRCPAQEAGIMIGDRIAAVNGRPINTAVDLSEILERYPNDTVEILLLREGKRVKVSATTEPGREYAIGISCVTSRIKSLRGGGVAGQVGFKEGDTIIGVNGRQVRGIVEVEDTIRDSYGTVSFSVLRGDQTLQLSCEIPDLDALREFLFSLECEAGTALTWVREDSPAWRAGMRPGDTIVSVAGQSVDTWNDILEAGGRRGKKPRTMEWQHDGEVRTAEVTPVNSPRYPAGSLGLVFREPKMTVRKYGIWKALTTGVHKTYATAAEILLTFKGFARRQVSPRNLGGVVMIAYTSYRAAQQGIAKLLYFTGVISACLALLNILPIPVLDGGHLMFLAIEKVRGRPVSETVMAISQYIGLALLIMLVIYVTRNDIARLLQF